MRAMVLDQLGPQARFRAADLPVPEPGPGQVRVRVRAVGVNPADVAIRTGLVPLAGPRFPLVIGWDLAGVVDTTGAGVTDLVPGQEVLGFSAFLQTGVGTYAEHVVLDRGDVAARPAGWSAAAAAALPSSGLTAVQAVAAAEVGAGDRVVVFGAAGAVGALTTQLAVARGALVTAVVSAADTDRVRELGATDVLDRTGDVRHEVHRRHPGGADVAINAARGQGPVALDCVRDHGRFATVADQPAPGPRRGIVPVEVLVRSDPAQLAELAGLAANGTLGTRVHRVLPAERADEAHDLLQAGGLAGKVVLRFDATG